MRSLKSRFFISFALILGLLALVGMLTVLGMWAGRPPEARAQPGTGIIRVATTGSDTPDCGDAATPCRTVQYAVDQAADGDEILIATGTYSGVQARPAPAGYLGPANITQVVYISKTVTIRGGYTTTNWTTPDPVNNPTTLDAQGQGRVLFITGDITTTIDGVRVRGGDAFGLRGAYAAGFFFDAGGGVYALGARVAISGTQVYSNTATWGGGLYLSATEVTLKGNTIVSNTASFLGGGLSASSSDVTLRDNTVSYNTANGLGGGLYILMGETMLLDNTVSGNTANDDGGGLYALGGIVLLSGNTVDGNMANDQGGGLHISFNDVSLIGNTVRHNTASGEGGGCF